MLTASAVGCTRSLVADSQSKPTFVAGADSCDILLSNNGAQQSAVPTMSGGTVQTHQELNHVTLGCRATTVHRGQQCLL